VDNIVQLGAQTLVPKYSELIEPGMIDEASIVQPVDRVLRAFWIRDDSNNHADL
jgi:hypothetical protein